MNIHDFIDRQLGSWPEAAERHRALAHVESRSIDVFGQKVTVQFNPSRAISTAAKVDAASIAARPCFLCAANRPRQQSGLAWKGYTILVNPYPIFRGHLVIAADSHTPQSLKGRTADMRELSRLLPGYTVLFNGARAGASAPDHMHFQAVPSEYVTVPRFCFSYELPEGAEPESDEMVNVLCTDGRITVIPRRAHRPSRYGEITVSPASIDMGGTFITVRREDFERLDSDLLEEIVSDVTFRRPEVEVGIIDTMTPRVTSHGDTTEVADVTIGIGFHWERRQTQRFAGTVELHPLPDGRTRVVNRVDAEEYLRSVISSEMNATSSAELLKAHAVISRRWLFAQLRLTRCLTFPGTPTSESRECAGEEIIKWYDRDDHTDFDVCADDHCQRYQGVTRASTPQVDIAVSETAGMVLATADGYLCDTRFSKCCGGVTETFENCWESRHHPYLTALADTATPTHIPPGLHTEEGAAKWIKSAPVECHCNTSDSRVLSQVLNDFDQETTPDFFRWTVRYSQRELSELIARRSGLDFGTVTSLTPLERGASGRITRLRITGTRLTRTVGKELEIRRWLSDSHLRSSAFTVERGTDGSFTLHGAGWGHGVGLCQIGAAMMAEKGYSYREILAHYFPETVIKKLY